MGDTTTPGDFDQGQPVSHEAIMNTLMRASHNTERWRKEFEKRMRHVEDTQLTMLKELRENTAVTTEVRDGMTTVRTMKKLVIGIGTITASLAAIYAFFQQVAK